MAAGRSAALKVTLSSPRRTQWQAILGLMAGVSGTNLVPHVRLIRDPRLQPWHEPDSQLAGTLSTCTSARTFASDIRRTGIPSSFVFVSMVCGIIVLIFY